MSATGYARTLAAGKAPVYLIHGEETFLTRQAMEWLRARVLAGAVEDFNLDRFDARENLDPDRITQAARTLPMMADRRLVWVRNAEALFATTGETQKSLVAYVEDPDPSTCLVFQAMDRVKKNHKLYKRIEQKGCIFESKSPPERELPAWVKTCAETRDRNIRPDAAALLVEAVGRDLAALDAAVERLALYVPPPQPIELAHVEETVPHTRVRTVWELIEAVAERDVARTLERAHQLVDQGEEPLRLLALIIYQFRQLLIGRAARDAGVPAQDAAKAAGVPPFKARAFIRQLDNYRRSELLAALERLSEADRALKSSKLPSGLIFEAVLLDLCAPRT
ncbi:MAG: DNA polymerase III subunit delta [bacterium]